MWLFCQKGFLSIVEDENDNGRLLVRGRLRGDIEEYFPDANVFIDEDADYRFRAFIKRDQVADVVKQAVMDINYPKFKPYIRDKEIRGVYYLEVWSIMMTAQDTERLTDG